MNGKTHTHYFITITNNNLLCNLSEILHACEEALTENTEYRIGFVYRLCCVLFQ